MKYQLNLFFLALGFFSRIPVPSWVDYSPEKLNQCNRYFALVGWLLGAVVAFSFFLADLVFSVQVSVFLAMLVSLILTGVFHEDGLADTADGFGGGMDKNRKLEIMKDSRLGTYGVTALVMALLGKWLLLSEIQAPIIAILVAYPVSRAIAASLIYDLKYVSVKDSKSKPLAMSQSKGELFLLLSTAGLSVFFFEVIQATIIIGCLVAFRIMIKRWLLAQIGGYTGDNLGAVQQASELMIYFLLHILWL